MKMKTILSVLFAVFAVMLVRAADESALTASIDTRDPAARELANISELQALAWTSSSNWLAGGEAGVAVSIFATPMTGSDPADPGTWSPSGEAVGLFSATGGEGAETWAVTRQNLYRLELKTGDKMTVAYFNLSETEGLSGGKPISEDGEVTAEVSVLPATGLAVHPVVVVKNGGKTLVEGTDYVLEYANDVNVGTGKVTVVGIGDYKGTMTFNYTIAPVADVQVAESGAYDNVAFDGREGEVLVVRWQRNGKPIAWNSSEAFPVREHSLTNYYYSSAGEIVTNTIDRSLWLAGGDPDETVRSRVSVAPLESVDAEPGEFTVLKEASGEGAFEWTAKNGFWFFKLEKVDGEGNVTGALSRILKVRGANGLVIQVR